MLTLKKVKEMVKAPVHTKRVPSPKVLLEDGRILLRKEFEHDSHLTLYHSGYVLFSAGKRNTVFHIHDCCGDYAYDAAEGKGDVIEEEYFENCEWHIRALFEGERKMEDNQAKCKGAGRSNVCVSYHALSEDWSEIADRTINMLEKIIENEAVHAMLAVLTEKQRNLIYQIILHESGAFVTQTALGFDGEATRKMRTFLQGPKPELLHHQKFFENGTAERAKESGTEQNYNMIDGCVNNVPKKPRRIGGRWSVLDRLHIKQAERRQKDNAPQQEQERSRKS